MRKMPKRLTEEGFRLYEPGGAGRLLADAGFGGIEMVPGSGPRAGSICAVGAKSA